MNGAEAKAEARLRVAELVAAFERNEADYVGPQYNETQARTEFISPLLAAFGWDVNNVRGHQLALREVIEEPTVEVGEERASKRPDYELRLARERKLFVEAKKPSVRMDTDPAPAFQIRRYGYSASLPISVLTNFRHLVIYDCRIAPRVGDAANACRRLIVSCEEFDARFDELWSLLSRESVYSGEFDLRFETETTFGEAEQFDDLFLGQVRTWRLRLAEDICRNTPGLTSAELTYVVQLFLSRIIFLRICEDRDIERYETLRGLDGDATFDALMAELRRADAFYDSGLFRLSDDAGLEVRISDATLGGIIEELYYPASPYTFAVVEPEVLGQIYEHFLGDVIEIEGGSVEIVNKPEVRESGGVLPTPRYIADVIAERTLRPLLDGRSPEALEQFTVADICCGSGTFLLAALEVLLDHYLNWYLNNDREAHEGHRIYEGMADQWRLTFDERRRILMAHLRGVDIDPNAVEITQFSLLLKLIEGETADALQEYVERTGCTGLPALHMGIRCGNSLVRQSEWRAALGTDPDEDQVNPFDWETEYAEAMGRGGFDAVIGNPPYIRIQNMAKYSPEEVRFFRRSDSPYTTAEHYNFDKYLLFIERAVGLAKEGGRVGMIVPHKFMTIQSGGALRRLIAGGRMLDEMVHFGAKQVFGADASNYTCILVLDRATADTVRIERPERLGSWRYGERGTVDEIPATELGEDPWRFADADARALFTRILATIPEKLAELAEVFVGVQTSADKTYIFKAVAETEATCVLRWNERDWPIERGILRPSLLDAPLAAFQHVEMNTWIMFPYELAANAAGRVRARLIQPPEMARRFPNCWAYLSARRMELEQRSIMGGRAAERQWYQYGRSQSLTKMTGEKIILPVLSLGPSYASDDQDTIVTGGGNGPYYLIRSRPEAPVSNHYLLAALNHPLSEAFVRTKTSVFRGGYYSHDKQFIDGLPIPVPDGETRGEIEVMVARLIRMRESLVAARTPYEKMRLNRSIDDLRRQIEERMSRLFGLSDDDLAVVDSVPTPE